jgi:hypothetical protein
MNRIASAQIPEILNNPTPQLINKSGLERLEIYKFVDEDGKHKITLKQKKCQLRKRDTIKCFLIL